MTETIAVGILTNEQLGELLRADGDGLRWVLLQRVPVGWLQGRDETCTVAMFQDASVVRDFERGVAFGEAFEVRWVAVADRWRVRRIGPRPVPPFLREVDCDVARAQVFDQWLPLWGTVVADEGGAHPRGARYAEAQVPYVMSETGTPSGNRLAIQVRTYLESTSGQPYLFRFSGLGAWR
ncbi:MAG: hypothetical protein KatS3mg060_2887 [Dehalococcoidia bacterium]|nr:MAG: hypothetical protein KatS3mg060_2887 [Dehalococcoidia bacterium]